MTVESGKNRVIVAGFGPVGRVLVDRLEQCGTEVTLIELNPDTVFKQQGLGRNAIQGDVTEPAVLTKAGIATADALLLTIPDEDAALRACRLARELAPSIYIAARTNFVSRGLLASSNGADHVVVEELVTAQAMTDAVIGRFDPSLRSASSANPSNGLPNDLQGNAANRAEK